MRNLKKYFFIAIIIFLFSSEIVFSVEKKALIKVCSYPQAISDYYFRPIVYLAVLDNTLIGVENFRNKATTFIFVPPRIDYTSEIGRPGQGPGDLIWPISISIDNNEIAIKEANYFSIFDKKGNLLSKFRCYSDNIAFLFLNQKIYWVNPIPNHEHIIEVYSKEGRMIKSFGEKYIQIDLGAHKNPHRILSIIYEGNILSDRKNIFYFNARFADYFVFSLEGALLTKGNLAQFFGERASKLIKYNTDKYINQKTINAPGYPRDLIFEDAYLIKNFIYFINTQIKNKNSGPLTIFNIKGLEIKDTNENKFDCIHDFIIERQGACRLDSFAVMNFNEMRYFVLSISVMEEGYFLEIYRQ